MKEEDDILHTFCNTEIIIGSDSESKSDHYFSFVDAFDYMVEDNCKMSNSSGTIPNDISRVTEALSYVDISLPKNNTNQKSVANRNNLSEKKKSDWFTSFAKKDYCQTM